MRQKIISGLFFPCSGVTVLPVDLGADFLPPHPQQVGPIPVYLSAGFFGIEGSVQPLRCPALHPQRPCQWICPARLGTSSSSYATPLHHGMGQVLILPHLRLGQLAVLLRILPVSQSAPDVAGHISLIRRNLPLFLVWSLVSLPLGPCVLVWTRNPLAPVRCPDMSGPVAVASGHLNSDPFWQASTDRTRGVHGEPASPATSSSCVGHFGPAT